MQNFFVKIFSAITIFFASINPFQTPKVVLQSPGSPLPTAIGSPTTHPLPSITPVAPLKTAVVPSPTVVPTRVTTPKPSPNPTPTVAATPRPTYLDSRTLTLVPTGDGPITARTGRVTINLTGTANANTGDVSYRIFNFTWSGSVSGLETNKSYSLQLCTKNDNCSGYGSGNLFTTDSNGNASFSMPPSGAGFGGVGYTVNKEDPYTYVIVVEPSDSLDLNRATLKADYNLTTGF